ncbi:MAG: (d)CMP kinase [Trichococcus flocculiformis]|jgi:cytidylate kinase|nr:(d)CMP kinase [Trichococcus sp.]HRA69424.1 (d)CMP kinase [Trichococcus flocculiformis]MBP6246350.1 (d)CMP kinase [Trichococcus sp.]MBP7127865.1 (d)CMP kinase [Trichococcus sp.]MBP8682318.1 (d)CMP kinase [Trichococcus sp.]
MNIAIDGPASAGKSTIAKKVAEQLGYIYLDTGAMYRTLTYAALSNEVDLQDEEALHTLLKGIRITFSTAENEMQRVFLNDEDVTDSIRSEEVTQNVSLVSSFAKVREEMVARQKSIARSGGVVMDGRDIGTVVLPDAEVKIFMTATAEERALRRYKENIAKGMTTSLEELTEDMKRRDHLDSTRSVSPLKKAEDAIVLDSTHLEIDEVVKQILGIIEVSLNPLQTLD